MITCTWTGHGFCLDIDGHQTLLSKEDAGAVIHAIKNCVKNMSIQELKIAFPVESTKDTT